jgi:hypothetical protein
MALRNLRDRLERLYDGVATLTLDRARWPDASHTGGAEVVVTLPLVTPAASAIGVERPAIARRSADDVLASADNVLDAGAR